MLVLSFLRDFIDLWNPKFCKTEYLVSLNLATSSQIPKPRIRPNRYNVQHGDYSEQHGDYSEQYYIVYLKAAKKIDLKSSHHGKKKNCNYLRCACPSAPVRQVASLSPTCTILSAPGFWSCSEKNSVHYFKYA